VLRIAQLIHDADVEDDKFHRVEGLGVEQIFKGWAKQGLGDQEILSKGFECFDGLYAQFKRSRKTFDCLGNPASISFWSCLVLFVGRKLLRLLQLSVQFSLVFACYE
jgi:hypothetical protein